MKNYYLIYLIIIYSNTCYSQVTNYTFDSSLNHCIKRFFIEERSNKQDSIFIFNNSKPAILLESYKDGGIFHSIKYDKLEVDTSKDISNIDEKMVIFHQYSFSFFLDFITSAKKSSKNIFSNIKGSYAYLYISKESWEQFYLDSLLGYDSLFIKPIVDVFETEKNSMKHTRYELSFVYTTNNGFVMDKLRIIRLHNFELVYEK